MAFSFSMFRSKIMHNHYHVDHGPELTCYKIPVTLTLSNYSPIYSPADGLKKPVLLFLEPPSKSTNCQDPIYPQVETWKCRPWHSVSTPANPPQPSPNRARNEKQQPSLPRATKATKKKKPLPRLSAVLPARLSRVQDRINLFLHFKGLEKTTTARSPPNGPRNCPSGL